MAGTALDEITRALKLANILGEGQTPSAEQANDALDTWNDMLQAWNLDSLLVYQTNNDQVTLLAGQQTYTVGSGGNFNVDRPAQINSAYVDYQSVSFRLDEVNQDEWNLITLKALTSILPRFFLYLNTFPLGTFQIWPVPQQNLSLFLSVDRVLSQIASTATAVSFPPGYRKAMRANLAVELCPEYGREPSPTLAKLAQQSLADIKRGNYVPVVAEYDPALIGAPGGLAAFLSGY